MLHVGKQSIQFILDVALSETTRNILSIEKKANSL